LFGRRYYPEKGLAATPDHTCEHELLVKLIVWPPNPRLHVYELSQQAVDKHVGRLAAWLFETQMKGLFPELKLVQAGARKRTSV